MNKRKIITNTFITLDGVMQAPGGPEEDPTGGFRYGGWSVNYWDKNMMNVMGEYMEKPFDLLLGRKTYEIFAAHWPFVKNDPNELNAMAADKMNNARKYVVSKTMDKPEWQNSMLITGDVAKKIKELKKQDGPEIQVHGSSSLIQTLLKHNLVDEFRVWIFPLVIGRGKRLFGDGTTPSGLKLMDTKISETGVIIAAYKPAGDIKPGTAELETPTEAEILRRKKLKEEENSTN